MDSYPIILTSRVLSVADLVGNLTERLMDGFYPAAFYRPLLNLSFAIDHALWGLSAAGYQLSNVLYFAACGLSLYAFLVTRPVPRAPVYAIAGVIVFLFHPLQWEVLPFPPRRPELMCSAFMLLALTAEARDGWRFRVLGGVATLLALGAKETAVILPGLVFLRMLVYARAGSARERIRVACGRALASVVPVAIYLAARFAVLGGMGGRGQIDPGKAFEIFPQTWGTLVRTVTFPSSPESWQLAVAWLILCLPLLLLVLLGRQAVSAPDSTGEQRAFVADLLFSTGWLVLLTVIYTLSKRLSPWYIVVAVVALAIAFAGVCEGYASWLRRRPIGLRAAGGVGLAAALLLVYHSQVRFSPVIRSYSLWQQATTEDGLLLQRFEQILEEAENGTVTWLPAELKKITAVGEASMFRGVVLQAHYSLQAWVEMLHPEKEVRVLKNRRALKAAVLEPTEIAVIMDRRAKSKPKQQKAAQPVEEGGAARDKAGGEAR